MKTEVLQE